MKTRTFFRMSKVVVARILAPSCRYALCMRRRTGGWYASALYTRTCRTRSSTGAGGRQRVVRQTVTTTLLKSDTPGEGGGSVHAFGLFVFRVDGSGRVVLTKRRGRQEQKQRKRSVAENACSLSLGLYTNTTVRV